jgi:hypothetical protein
VSAFEATLTYGTAQPAALEALVKSVCVLAAISAVSPALLPLMASVLGPWSRSAAFAIREEPTAGLVLCDRHYVACLLLSI